MPHLTSGGDYVGIDYYTGVPYVKPMPDGPGPWETCAITPQGQFSDICYGPWQLCVNPQTRALESRKAGDHWGWGGQWAIATDGKMAACDQWSFDVHGLVVTVAPSKLRIEGRDFVNASGRYTVIGSTELLMAWRYDMEGPDAIRPVLAERRDLGFNNLRWLWQKDINNSNHPWSMPLQKLQPALALAAEYGMYVQGTILADCQVVNPNVGDQQRRVNDVRAWTASIANLLEQLGNEAEKNGHDPRKFSRPTDRLAANSSATTGGADYPYWDFFCFSGRRDPCNSWIRENGPVEFMYSNGKPWGGVPAICDEGAKPGTNDYQPRDWERAGAQARSGCGGRLHTVTGTGDKNQPWIVPSGMFTAFERECAQAFVKGLKG